MSLRERTIVLGVSASISAYKAIEVARLLVSAGASVVPVMTASATKLVGPTTFAALTGHAVETEMFDPAWAGEKHVDLAARADCVLLSPATADLLARLASGRADDLLSALALCARGPVVAAPAMHARMWDHPATRRNVETLARDGRVSLVGPVHGPLASGEVGMGRLADPAEIVAAVERAIGPLDLAGRRVVVTAGPTVEDLDPVRFLGNRSSGRMGFAIAERAAARGAEVRLVTGPVALATPPGVARVDVRSALEMQAALEVEMRGADALVMAAAVADFRPREVSKRKVKKGAEASAIELVRTPDLLAEIGARRAGVWPVLVGFAVETGDDETIVRYARGKLEAKKVDVVVANHAADAFGRDTNRVTLVSSDAVVPVATTSKLDVADVVLDFVRQRLSGEGSRAC